MATHQNRMESSGDFGFTDDNEDEDDDDSYDDDDNDDYDNGYNDYYDEEDEDEFSGSGDGETTVSPKQAPEPSAKPDANDNKIPEVEHPERPAVNEVEIVQNSNEIPLLRNKEPAEGGEEFPSNVLMAHASDDSIFNKTEVLAVERPETPEQRQKQQQQQQTADGADEIFCFQGCVERQI
ncbi:hypothetical protein JOB18_037004 [Solea senegalensis]|uniref:Uncharacterized protein n=1 Tax=Solea senegalensis TaxID=28829 RepID=A0AAV6QNZ4_SOLSE|nr:hypothetical protein JOB18_037004 [Solea senegalensis]